MGHSFELSIYKAGGSYVMNVFLTNEEQFLEARLSQNV